LAYEEMVDVDDEESDKGEENDNDESNRDLSFRFFRQTRDHGGGLIGVDDHLLPEDETGLVAGALSLKGEKRLRTGEI
jgi:hypothetical protein